MSWTVHYEKPPMRAIYTKLVLAASADKAKLHIEMMVPNCRVIKVV